MEAARETAPHWRAISWAENRLAPSQEICQGEEGGKPRVGRGRVVQRKLEGGLLALLPTLGAPLGKSIPVP